MAKFLPALTPELREWIAEQKMFFVATAPNDGRVNLSPKGLDTFRCLSDSQVAYLDLTGSGAETAAHLLENGRITLMFCAFDRAPRILRIYGSGHAVRPRDDAWDAHYGLFEPRAGARQVFVVDVDEVQTSCGFAVPFYEFKGARDTLDRLSEKKDAEGAIETYWQEKNVTSIDGLPTGIVP